VPPADARPLATLRAVKDALEEQGDVYRFRYDARPPADAECGFRLCGLLIALAALFAAPDAGPAAGQRGAAHFLDSYSRNGQR